MMAHLIALLFKKETKRRVWGAGAECALPQPPCSPAGVHDHHQLVSLRAVPDRQLDLPQRGLSQCRPTEEAKQTVTALFRPDGGPESLLQPHSKVMFTHGDARNHTPHELEHNGNPGV